MKKSKTNGSENRTPKTMSDSNKRQRGEDRHPSTTISITLTDSEVLDCPICLDPLSPPVYECENGHITCDSCYTKINKESCPTCSCPVGSKRCRAIEKVLECAMIACSNKPHGCADTISYSNKLHHEKACCLYAPCSCSVPGCGYVGSSELLYQHILDKHRNFTKDTDFNKLHGYRWGPKHTNYLFLLEKTEKVVFIVSRFVETRGSVWNIVCISPAARKTAFSYEVTAINGPNEITRKGPALCVPDWSVEQLPSTLCILVPNDFNGADGFLTLRVLIRKG